MKVYKMFNLNNTNANVSYDQTATALATATPSTSQPTILTPAVQKHVTTWIAATKKTITAIFEQAAVIKNAKTELQEVDYKSFLAEIAITESSAKKFLVIADKISLLQKSQEKLPANWTTIYQIAKHDEEVIKKLLSDASVNADVTASKVAEIVSLMSTSNSAMTQHKRKESNAQQAKLLDTGCYALIDFSKLSELETTFVLSTLVSLGERADAIAFSASAEKLFLKAIEQAHNSNTRQAA